jgi:hypothetical protein
VALLRATEALYTDVQRKSVTAMLLARREWREIADVDLDEFCDVKWTSTAKVVPA